MSRKEPKYPIFLECSQYTLDEYWIDIFKNCSLGKFPKGMIVYANTIRVTVAKKKYEMIDMHDDPLEMFKLCMDVFKNKLKMTSSRDHRVKNEEFEKIKKKRDVTLSTLEIVKKHKVEKDRCINDFILRMQSKHSLTIDEARRLSKIVKSGLLFKTIHSQNIIPCLLL